MERLNLFEIPSYKIDTADYDHSLHGSIVEEFEKKFAEYVDAEYACTVDSCTNAITMALLYAKKEEAETDYSVSIPAMSPPVVSNAIHHAGMDIIYKDEPHWVGWSYILKQYDDWKIIDSAQRVDRYQFSAAYDQDLMLFSFYPTKPVGGMDGGMVVTNDKKKYQWFKSATKNGMSQNNNSWDRKLSFHGWKAYMNTVQVDIAMRSFDGLDERKKRLTKIRDTYNKEFRYNNISDHLYRLQVDNNQQFITHMTDAQIICGVHYKSMSDDYKKCKLSYSLQYKTVSIPMHNGLTDGDVERVIHSVKSYLGEINETKRRVR